MIQVIPAFFALVVAGGLVVPPAPAVQAPDAAGTWDVVFNTPNGARKGKLVLKRDGETLTGAAVAENAAEYKIEGQQKGADVSMHFTYTGGHVHSHHHEGNGQGRHDERHGDIRQRSGRLDRHPGGSGRRTGWRHAGGARHQRGVAVRGHDGRGFGKSPAVTFKQSGETLTGQYSGQLGEAPIQGTLKGNELTFSFDVSVQDTKLHIVYSGTAAKDALEGHRDPRRTGRGHVHRPPEVAGLLSDGGLNMRQWYDPRRPSSPL